MRTSVFKAIVVSAFAVVAGTSMASAADMAPRYTKAPVIVDPIYNWTGFYIGGNAGYSWGRSRNDANFFNNTTNVLLATGSSSFDMNGWVAGGQIGYNWQSARWVFGLEGDAQATGQKGSTGYTCAGTVCSLSQTAVAFALAPVNVAFSQKLEWFSTLRGRVGYTFTPTVLGYVTGGAAIGEVNTNGVITGVAANGVASAAAFSGNDTRVGWTVGAGLEASLGGNWTGKVEYLYLDLGKYTNSAVLLLNAPPSRVDLASRVTDNILRAGVNYRFGGPVVAKY
jgi:outer membrane immunogenic protein